MVYFKLQLDHQELSNLTYKIPEECVLFIGNELPSEEFYGIIDDDYYQELVKYLPRQNLDSLEIVDASCEAFLPLNDARLPDRQFAGNLDLLRRSK